MEHDQRGSSLSPPLSETGPSGAWLSPGDLLQSTIPDLVKTLKGTLTAVGFASRQPFAYNGYAVRAYHIL